MTCVWHGSPKLVNGGGLDGNSRRLTMQTMNISLPEPLKEFVNRQVSSGRYGSVSEYVRELVREDDRDPAA
jgi:hypothetical protein